LGFDERFYHVLNDLNASLSVNRAERKRYWNRPVASPICLSVCLCVCLSVCPEVYCGKMADWIQMLFGMVTGVGRGTGVLDEGGDR